MTKTVKLVIIAAVAFAGYKIYRASKALAASGQQPTVANLLSQLSADFRAGGIGAFGFGPIPGSARNPLESPIPEEGAAIQSLQNVGLFDTAFMGLDPWGGGGAWFCAFANLNPAGTGCRIRKMSVQ